MRSVSVNPMGTLSLYDSTDNLNMYRQMFLNPILGSGLGRAHNINCFAILSTLFMWRLESSGKHQTASVVRDDIPSNLA